MLAPGFYALDSAGDDSGLLLLAELAHGGIIIVLFTTWLRQWKRLLSKTALQPSLPTTTTSVSSI